jgi:hypothetical protein
MYTPYQYRYNMGQDHHYGSDYSVDANGDGIPDYNQNYDLNGDGIIDNYPSGHMYGNVTFGAPDTNLNGVPDYIESNAYYDANQDGIPDSQ